MIASSQLKKNKHDEKDFNIISNSNKRSYL